MEKRTIKGGQPTASTASSSISSGTVTPLSASPLSATDLPSSEEMLKSRIETVQRVVLDSNGNHEVRQEKKPRSGGGTRKFSKKIIDVFEHAMTRPTANGPVITIPAFIYALFQGRGAEEEFIRAGLLVASESGRLTAYFDDRRKGYAERERNTKRDYTPGLNAAFSDAFSIRDQTGGQDDYIGLRHLLFSIFNCEHAATRNELAEFFNFLDISSDELAQEAYKNCLRYVEPDEDITVWETIHTQRVASSFQREMSSVTSLNPDDPWRGGVRDRSGAGREAEAFALMICNDRFQPPLAVGVFGEWGAGKSFFLRLVHEAITAITDPTSEKVRQVDGQSRSPKFLTNIVQIRFNAWHYAETNLWASLVDQIFTKLDQWARDHNPALQEKTVFDSLSTARKLAIDSAEELVRVRRERDQATAKHVEAEQKLAASRKELELSVNTWVDAAWKSVAPKGDEAKNLDNAIDMLGFGGLYRSSAEFVTNTGDLDRRVGEFSVFASPWRRLIALPFIVTAVFVGLCLVPIILEWADLIKSEVGRIGAAVAGALLPIVAAIGFLKSRTQDAVKIVSEYREKFKQQVEAGVAGQKAARDDLQQQVVRAEAAVLESRRRLELAANNAASLAKEYNSQTSKGRVLEFVRERISNAEYAKHLSFVATVRKDFEELSNLMTISTDIKMDAALKAQALQIDHIISDAGEYLDEGERAKLKDTVSVAPPEVAVVFERIVLYIDDLDRCPFDQVVAVLQAIHLLLTFPLFVVFVAVDSRWVKQALSNQFPGLTASDGRTSIVTDYLEKIFQVPYWVRPMSAESTRGILRDSIGPLISPYVQSENSAPPTDGNTEKASEAEFDTNTEEGVFEESGPSRPSASALSLNEKERAFIDVISEALDGYPRRTLRFINSYRIIKASLGQAQQVELSETGYPALMTLLAISIGLDDCAMPIFSSCRNIDSDVDIVTHIKEHLKKEDVGISELNISRVLHGLDHYLDQVGANSRHLQEFIPLVARFSFAKF